MLAGSTNAGHAGTNEGNNRSPGAQLLSMYFSCENTARSYSCAAFLLAGISHLGYQRLSIYFWYTLYMLRRFDFEIAFEIVFFLPLLIELILFIAFTIVAKHRAKSFELVTAIKGTVPLCYL
ncbi:hypothetical protein J3F84DRAFT_390080 [Trichoderma pleuroticola]